MLFISSFLKLFLFVIREFWKVCGTGTMDGEVRNYEDGNLEEELRRFYTNMDVLY